MTQEEKSILLRDLCARLPYGVIVKYCNKDFKLEAIDADSGELFSNGVYMELNYDDIKPYLRPMSSMTEEERKEVEELIKSHKPSPDGIINNEGMDNLLFSVSITSGYLIDWLTKKMFDFRGLIPMGLALEAPEGMYK